MKRIYIRNIETGLISNEIVEDAKAASYVEFFDTAEDTEVLGVEEAEVEDWWADEAGILLFDF